MSSSPFNPVDFSYTSLTLGLSRGPMLSLYHTLLSIVRKDGPNDLTGGARCSEWYIHSSRLLLAEKAALQESRLCSYSALPTVKSGGALFNL